MIRLFRRQRKMARKDKVEARFQAVVDLIRDLDKRDFNRLKDGMDLAWQAYQKVGKAQTTLEKETAEIDAAEKYLEAIQ